MKIERPFTKEDWQATPEPVRKHIISLEETVIKLVDTVSLLEKRIEKLESQLNKNSSNSSKPPSSDPPFKKPPESRKPSGRKRKKGGQKGHKGHRRTILEPNHMHPIYPDHCSCGACHISAESLKPFYTHQVIELPPIDMDVHHYVLHKGICSRCGSKVKATIPEQHRTGYGPRLSAFITDLSGTYGNSRGTVQEICRSILNFHISVGAIQNVIDRGSQAIKPIYNHIGLIARNASVNYIDETSWFLAGKLKWLWTMSNEAVSYFKIHSNRSREAFNSLIADWKGILVSDGYGVYKHWENGKQSCLAHLIRDARSLSEREDESLQRFGKNILQALQQLCSFAKSPPSEKELEDWYSQIVMFIILFESGNDDAGAFARRLTRQIDDLMLFLEEDGVAPTNNRAERALRYGVLWRKRSHGTQSEKGNRWVERILTLKQTCRTKKTQTFPLLVDAIDAFFKEQSPNLAWVE